MERPPRSARAAVEISASTTWAPRRRSTTAAIPRRSEKIGFDFGSAVTGLDLMLGGIGRTSGGKEGAILKTYDAEGDVLDTLLLTEDDNLGLSFSAPVRYATLEASPWISSDGDLPGSEPDFVLNWFETLA